MFDSLHQLTSCDPKKGTFLACALLARGQISVSDMRRNIDRFLVVINFTAKYLNIDIILILYGKSFIISILKFNLF